MLRFKRTNEILNSPWFGGSFDTNSHSLPVKEPWSLSRPPEFFDIEIWEELHQEEGILGVYAAWNPYTDLYAIVHKLHVGIEQGIEVFYGDESVEQVINRCKELGVSLEITQQWVDATQVS